MAYDRSAACKKMLKKRWLNDRPEGRFWKKVNKNGPNGCWIWEGSRTKENYGVIRVKGRRVVVSRFAYTLLVGKIPDGHLVCHHCDNPPCCNPKHLFAGTSLDNVRDCVEKGRARSPRGSEHVSSHLTDQQIKEILGLRDSGITQIKIAAMFGVNQSNISRIFNGKRWAHIK